MWCLILLSIRPKRRLQLSNFRVFIAGRPEIQDSVGSVWREERTGDTNGLISGLKSQALTGELVRVGSEY